jgi:hypothetical protein
MWKVHEEILKAELPQGFRLMENEDIVYLFHGEEEIASFSSTGVDHKIIENVARTYQASLQINEGKGGNQQ